MKTSDLMFFIIFGMVVAFIITGWWRARLRKRRTVTALTARTRHEDERFGRGYFPDLRRADIAIRIRRVLSHNLEMPLDGLTPNDRLNDDLGAELPANPDLFWALEGEFGIKTGVEDIKTFESVLAQLVTFQDLVEYVERKISEGPAPGPAENEEPSRVEKFVNRSIPGLFFGGIAIVVLGIVVRNRTMITLGGLAFLSGLTVWGLVYGVMFLWALNQEMRRQSFKEIIMRPWPFILVAGLVAFYLWAGSTVFWGILKQILSLK